MGKSPRVNVSCQQAVDGFLASCRARNLSPQTIIWYKTLLNRFLQKNRDLPAAPGPIEEFLGAIKGSDRTKHGYYRALKAFYRWASPRYHFSNPMLEISAPRTKKTIPRTLSLADLGSLLAAPLSKRDRAMIMLLIDAGIRIGEAVNLDRGDIHEDTIVVSGKTGIREVPISSLVRSCLVDLPGDHYLFAGSKGRLTTSGAYQAIREALIRAGISGKKLGPHTLRHTFGRQYVMAGGDLESLRRILGHSSILTTRIYTELDNSDIQRQHQRYTPLNSLINNATTERSKPMRKKQDGTHKRRIGPWPRNGCWLHKDCFSCPLPDCRAGSRINYKHTLTKLAQLGIQVTRLRRRHKHQSQEAPLGPGGKQPIG